MFKIEEYHKWESAGGTWYKKTRLYQSQKSFERFWLELTGCYWIKNLKNNDLVYKFKGFAINESGQWKLIKEYQTRKCKD